MPYYSTQYERGGFRWFLGDKPDVSGVLRVDGKTANPANFVGLTVILTRTNQILQPETFVELTTGGQFLYTVQDILEFQTEGNIFCQALPLASTGTVEVIGQGELGNKTLTTATVQTDGWAKVDDEILFFERVDSSTINIRERGLFGTQDAAHNAGATIEIAQVKEFAEPTQPFKVYDRRLI